MDELAKFSTLLKQINDPSPRSHKDLLAVFQEVFQLYGNERKNLLAGNSLFKKLFQTNLKNSTEKFVLLL